jgi:hypothetical protein
MGIVMVLSFMVKLGSGGIRKRVGSMLSTLPLVTISSGIVGYAMLYFTNRLLFQMCTSKGKCAQCTHKEGFVNNTDQYEANKKQAVATLQRGVKQVKTTMDNQQAARVGRPVVLPPKK